MLVEADLSRRQFLSACGWTAVGMTVLSGCSSLLPVLPPGDEPRLEDGLTWIQVLPDGRIQFFCPRAEMGQGISAALSQVVAEELNLDPLEIICRLPSTEEIPVTKMTVGSESVASFFEPVSLSAALLREALREQAGKQTGTPPEKLTDAPGGFSLTDGKVLKYRDLVGGEARIFVVEKLGRAAAPERYSLRNRNALRAIGRDWRPRDLVEIATGTMTYARDIQVDGMTYGSVHKPPQIGARLGRVDSVAAESVPGVLTVVVDRKLNCIGIVADSPRRLREAGERLEIEWLLEEPVQQSQLDELLDVDRHRAEDDFEHTHRSVGDLDASDAVHRVTSRYDTSFMCHAAMEPRSAVVSVGPDRVEVWGAGQDPFFMRNRVARVVGRSITEVVVYPHRLGGAFGGRILCHAAEEAAFLSAASGRPVRVQWTREEEFRYTHLQPQFSHVIQAAVDDEGRLSHWHHSFIASPIMFSSAILPKYLQRIVDLTEEGGTPRGSVPPYEIPNQKIRYSDIRIPLVTSSWRGLGAAPNTFAGECMIDEIATASGIDPLAFRLKNLPENRKRLSQVLEIVAERSGWGADSRSGAPPSALGMACAIYKDTYVAIVAKVELDVRKEVIRVAHVWCAHDCGLVLNPDQVKAQIEGNIVWGIGMALKESQEVADGGIGFVNFHQYEVMRNADVPDFDITIVEGEGERPSGAGEPAIAPTAAAIANALFALTGTRLRRLPIRYGDIVSVD